MNHQTGFPSQRWSGQAAMAGGLLAIGLTLPFASAYFLAYPGFDIPPAWLVALRPTLRPLLTFASPVTVYNWYGRVYNLVYVLALPAAFALHGLHRGPGRRLERWGFRLLVTGLLAALAGVAGDYWANGVGFILELLGLLALNLGATLMGAAIVRHGPAARASGWLLAGCLPGAVAGFLLTGHIPSGPTLLFALAWLVTGYRLAGQPGL